MLSVKIEGLPDVEATTRRVEAAIREPRLPHIWKALLADLRDYPPPPPRSTYVRTGHLARSWKVAFAQGRMPTLFQAVNSADYAEQVQGDPAQQLPIFRGRWTPASVILARYEDRIRAEWEMAIERAGD